MLILRMLIVLGIIVGMTALALPPVLQRGAGHDPPGPGAASLWRGVTPVTPVTPKTPAEPERRVTGRDVEPTPSPPSLAKTTRSRRQPGTDPPPADSHAPQPKGTASPIARPAEQQQRMAQLRDRLLAVGAMEMSLEQAADGGAIRGATPAGGENSPRPQYRFHCKVPLPNHPVYARSFQAEGATPLNAMQKVFRDVERWLGSG